MSAAKVGSAFFFGSVFGGVSVASYLLVSRERPKLKIPDGDGKLGDSGQGVSTENDLFKYGFPESTTSFHSYKAHSLTYDRSRKVPLWVAETIDSSKVQSKVASRKKSKFRPDPKVPACYSSVNEDFRKSGWSRGHMAPAGNCKHSQDAMDDTFYLTNVIPQDVDNNSGYWNRLEIYCRDLTKQFEKVHIITGPLFLPVEDQAEEKSFVKYQVVGRNKVAVPTHLYKVVLAEGGKEPALGVFIVPNKPIGNVDLAQFQVSLEELESHVGCTFLSKLDRDKVVNLCQNNGCKLLSQERIALMTYSGRLRAARTMQELEEAWDELKKAVTADDKAEELYLKRKTELHKSMS